MWRSSHFAVDAGPTFWRRDGVPAMRMFPYILMTAQFIHDKLMCVCVEGIPPYFLSFCCCYSHVYWSDSPIPAHTSWQQCHIVLWIFMFTSGWAFCGDLRARIQSRMMLRIFCFWPICTWSPWHFFYSCPFDKTDTPFHPPFNMIYPFTHP